MTSPSQDQDLRTALDERLKAAGMYTVAEMLGVTPLTKWQTQAGMTSIAFFEQWLDRRAAEFIRMKTGYDLGDKPKDDELYEWVLAHSAAFCEARTNLKAALTPAQAPDKAGEREGLAGNGAREEFIQRRDKAREIARTFIDGDTRKPFHDGRASAFDEAISFAPPAALTPQPNGTKASRGVGKSVGERISSPHYVDAVGSILIGVIGSAAAKHGGKITADGLIWPQEFWDALHPQLNAEIETYMARAMDEDRRRAATPTPPLSPDSTGPAGATPKWDDFTRVAVNTEAEARIARIEVEQPFAISKHLSTITSHVGNLYELTEDPAIREVAVAMKACAVDAVEAALTPSAPIAAPVRDDAARAILKRAVSALKPFAARVYNDNGDITVSDTYRCGLEEFTAAYFAHRACVDALASLPAPAGDVPGEAQTQEGRR